MSVLDVQGLRISFGARVLFDGVSFAVAEGEHVGVIGANGSGKTTLLRVLAGEEGAQAGQVALQRGARIGYLSQEPRFPEGTTIRQAVTGGNPELASVLAAYAEVGERLARGDGDPDRLVERQASLAARIEVLGGWAVGQRAEEVLTRLGVENPDRSTAGLSGGERKRVALARVLVDQPDLLLLDEPTNHLDAETTEWLESYLADFVGAVLLVTHDRYFLDRVVTRMLEVSTSEIVPYPGGYEEYLVARAERTERAGVEDAKRRRLIEQELAWVRRSPSARTGKQQARIDRLDSLQREQRDKRLPDRATVEMQVGDAPRLGRTVLNLCGIQKSFGDRTLVRDFSAMLRAGERIGIVGPNGAGKTTLLRIILQLESADAGEVEWGLHTRAAYFNQTRDDFDPDATVYETVANQDWVQVGEERLHVRSYLDRFLFAPSSLNQKVRSLSGGERNRLLLARLMLQDANLLVLDEPTNDLDLPTLQVLEATLAGYGGCVLMVTHDRFFLDKVATGLWAFEGNGVVHEHAGGWELYRRLREARLREATERARPTPRPQPRAAPVPQPSGSRKLSFKEQRELEAMEVAILEAEARRDELGERLADPVLYAAGYAAGAEEITRTRTEFEAAEAEVARLYARWEKLEGIATAGAAK